MPWDISMGQVLLSLNVKMSKCMYHQKETTTVDTAYIECMNSSRQLTYNYGYNTGLGQLGG